MQGGDSGVVASGLVTEPEIADGLMLLVRKLFICTFHHQRMTCTQLALKVDTFRNFAMTMSENRSLTSSYQTSLKRKHANKATVFFERSCTMAI